MSTTIGKVGPLRRIPAEALERDTDADKPTIHVYASRAGVELAAAPSVLTPSETTLLICHLVKALHMASVLGARPSPVPEAPAGRLNELDEPGET